MNDTCKCGKPTGGMYACAECREKIAAYKRKWRANMTEFQHEKELEKHRLWRKKNYATLRTYNHEYYLRRKENGDR